LKSIVAFAVIAEEALNEAIHHFDFSINFIE
jgi:hypothetical protein